MSPYIATVKQCTYVFCILAMPDLQVAKQLCWVYCSVVGLQILKVLFQAKGRW